MRAQGSLAEEAAAPPGGAVLNIYDELFKQDKVKHVLVRHEQGAVHAADGYSRSSQKIGVALVTSGPGVTNAVTGIATAYMDSVPMVVLTGHVPTHAIGQDAFQECDTVGITRPCVKHNFLVKNVDDLAVTIKKAFYLAQSGRPGPVLVDIPKDVTQASAEYSYPKTISMRSYNPVTKAHAGQIKKAVQLLLDAKRPMVYAGGGVCSLLVVGGFVEPVRRLAEFLKQCLILLCRRRGRSLAAASGRRGPQAEGRHHQKISQRTAHGENL